MGHASFVSHEGRQVTRLRFVILGERFDFASVSSTTLPREESEGTVPRSSKLSVTLWTNVLSDLSKISIFLYQIIR